MSSDLNTSMRDETRAQAKGLASLLLDGTEGIKGHIDNTLPEVAKKFETELSKTGDALTLRLESVQSTLEDLIKNSFEKALQPVSRPELQHNSDKLIGHSTVGSQTMNTSLSQAKCLAPQEDSTSSRAVEPQQLGFSTPVPESCNYNRASRRLQPRGKTYLHTQLKRNRKTLAGSLMIFSYLVQIRVATEYSPRAFLDNLQVQPNFTIRATVPSDPPAFTLV